MKSVLVLFCIALLFAAAHSQPAPHPTDPQILGLVEQIRSDSILSYITRLTQFHTRHTFSDTTSDSTGIGAAIRWVHTRVQEFDVGGRYTYEQFPWVGNFNGNSLTRNILIARTNGTSGDGARYIIGGHLDSRTMSINDNTGFAPGADDNGSSCAAFLELLRVAQIPFAHSLEVIWFTGEEQGLWGSEAYAQSLSQQGARVDGMIAMDMISHIASPGGSIDSTSVRLYAQGDPGQGGTASVSRNLQRYLKWVGEAYSDLDSFEMRVISAADRPGRGSDHLSFSGEGYPAVRVIERNEDLGYQHNSNDTPEHLSSTYARRIARCTFGALLTMLVAPTRPPAPLAEQISANIIRIQIPDSVVLPAGGRFYLTKRGWFDVHFTEIVDLDSGRQFDYLVTPGEQYGFSISRADSNDRPSPFSTETVIQTLPASDRNVLLPSETQLTAAPNPFNAEVQFTIELLQSGHVSLDVYDLLGRHVALLLDEPRNAGVHHVSWSPRQLASGLYLACLSTADKVYTLKVAYLR